MFKELFTEAKIKSEINQKIADAFKKDLNQMDRKFTFKEDGNTLIVTVKETSPNTSHNKINETQMERVIESLGGNIKIGRRELTNSVVWAYGDIKNLEGKRRLSFEMKDTKKFKTTTIKVI